MCKVIMAPDKYKFRKELDSKIIKRDIVIWILYIHSHMKS
jgi:hypothetical protein